MEVKPAAFTRQNIEHIGQAQLLAKKSSKSEWGPSARLNGFGLENLVSHLCADRPSRRLSPGLHVGALLLFYFNFPKYRTSGYVFNDYSSNRSHYDSIYSQQSHLSFKLTRNRCSKNHSYCHCSFFSLQILFTVYLQPFGYVRPYCSYFFVEQTSPIPSSR